MMEDIHKYDNHQEQPIREEPTPLRCHLCAHPICPIWTTDKASPGYCESRGLVKYDKHDRFKSCKMFKPYALPFLHFLARIAVVSAALFTLVSVIQVNIAVTLASGAVTVLFYEVWEWIDEKKRPGRR